MQAGGIVRLVWSVRKRYGVPPAVPAQTYAFLCSQEPAPTGLVWSVRKRHGVPPAVPAQTYAFLCSQELAPTGLYYAGRREQPYSRAVTGENADRLMALSRRLCGLPEEEAVPCKCGLSKEEAVSCKC